MTAIREELARALYAQTDPEPETWDDLTEGWRNLYRKNADVAISLIWPVAAAAAVRALGDE